MIVDGTYFELSERWDGDDETRVLFARLVESTPDLRYIPSRREVPSPWPDVTFNFEGEGVEDIPYQVMGWFLVSDKLKTIIEESRMTGIRFYPIQVASKLSFSLPRYWYGHLKLLDGAIDFERSVYSRKDIQGDEFLIMVKYALKRSAIEGWDFFRTAEATAAGFCSGRFRDLVLGNNCAGVAFRPVPVS